MIGLIRRLRLLTTQRPPRTLASLDAYALWAASYPPEAHNDLMRIEQAALLALLPPLAGCDVLDLACGSGRYSRIAHEHGARRVIGIDNSLPMLHAAAGSTFIQGTMDAIPLHADTCDVIICGLATGHLPPETMIRALREMERILKPGGTALISDFHPFMFLGGGRRTFTAPDGVQYAVEHYPHLISDYFAAIHSAGLTLDALTEPRAPGMAAPAVLILRVRK